MSGSLIMMGVASCCAVRSGRTTSARFILTEVCNNLDAMDLTIASPHRANYAVGSMTREVLYRRNVLAPPLRQDYLKVVVQYRETSGGETVGYVVSAYAVEAIDPQEAPKWTP